MGDVFVYILKSSICLAVFYLFFKLMLSKETFHIFNRVVLLSLFVFSLAIPFIEITLQKETPYSGLALNLDALLAMAQTVDVGPEVAKSADNWLVALLIIYMTGVAVTAFITVWSFARMYILLKIKETKRMIIEKNIVLVIHKKTIAPFSWMRFIAISEKDYNENGSEIITHEIAHISRFHSADLLLAELVKIIHWFNPAVWLLKQELQNIHEYQADEAVIQKGIDAKQYQLLLIKKAVGDRLYTMANSFNHSKLKSRITMITKKKSTRPAALKALFVLPLSVLAVVAFASGRVSTALEPVSEVKITDFIQKDTIKKEVKTIMVSINENGKGIMKTETGKIIVQSDKKEDRPLVIINGKETDWEVFNAINPAAIKSISVLKDRSAAEKYGEKGKNGVLVITLKNTESVSVTKSDNPATIEYVNIMLKHKPGDPEPICIVDGLGTEDYSSLDPNSIKSIEVFKGEAAVRNYGVKGKNGVILITTKNAFEKSNKNLLLMREANISAKDKPLYVIDGVVDSTFAKSISIESIESIESVTVIKDIAAAVTLYGDKAQNGVILITLKKGNPEENKKQAVKITGTKEIDEPLYVIDGVVKENFDMKSLDTSTIQSINILKDDAAVKKYGEKAKNGVIEVTLKQK
ncbi:MAG: M56 family metallopeptidase [Bacteroidales bacterium]|jgi:beta-lactamase regulating signal transducer with metallopeptidase domain